MYKSILIFMCSISIQANNLFLYDSVGGIRIEDVVNNKVNEYEIKDGYTYGLTNNLSIVTDTNGSAKYIFPHRIAISHGDTTSTYFNESDIIYDTDFKLSEVIKIRESNFNFTLNGQIYCISETTNQTTVSTSMANIIFGKSVVFIKSGEKYTHVYLIDGSATVFDSKSKKKKELHVNDYLVITPQIALSPRDGKVTLSGNSFSVKDIEDDEKLIHQQQLNLLKSKLDNTIFVNYNKNIFGVLIK